MGKRRRISFAVASLLALVVCPGSGQEAKEESPERVVQEQVDAYNTHDVDSFLGFYSAEVKLYDFPGKEISSGVDAMRKSYWKLFADNPDLKVDIAKRIASTPEETSLSGKSWSLTSDE